jgi:hypothetical protein
MDYLIPFRKEWGRSIHFVPFLLLLLVACTRIEDQQPKGTFETDKGPLPAFSLQLDSTGSGLIRFDSIAQGGNFSVSFTPMAHARLRIIENGHALQIQALGGNWEKDSTRYIIVKNNVRREGNIVLRNRQFVPDPVNTDCILLPIRTFYLPFLGSVEIRNLVPSGTPTLDSIRVDFWSFQNEGDSILTFLAAGGTNEQSWAWDTIRYQAHNNAGQCFKGKLAFVIGDTCEAHARNDLFTFPSGKSLFPETDLTQNDKGCNNVLGPHQTRTATEFDYGNYKLMNTQNGILVDTLVNGNQFYRYQRTNTSATEDGFIYYFKDLVSQRVTKAWVRIKFN